MALKKKVDFKKMANDLKQSRIKKLRLLSSEIIVGIIRRTQKGRDVNNQAFTEYNEFYGRLKAAAFGSDRPNLTVTGTMLNSISSRDIIEGIQLFFLNDFENKKASGNQKTRKFFGTDRKQRREIKKQLKSK